MMFYLNLSVSCVECSISPRRPALVLISSIVSPLFFPTSEWYGYHFPELIKIVTDNSTYCRLAQLIGNRKELNEERLESLEEVVMDSAKAQAIMEASRSSMGEPHEHAYTRTARWYDASSPFFVHAGL